MWWYDDDDSGDDEEDNGGDGDDDGDDHTEADDYDDDKNIADCVYLDFWVLSRMMVMIDMMMMCMIVTMMT